MSLKIKDIPVNERPIERLIIRGSESLSNEELLAILLNTGTKDFSAKDLAGMILKETDGNLKNLFNFDLTRIKGIGKKKSAIISAAIELGKRINLECSVISNMKITSASEVFRYYKGLFLGKKQECFYCIYLDNSKRVIKDKMLFVGSINVSVVHPREIFKEAYSVSASSIICVHNHPSGNVLPSREDVNLTHKLKDIGELFGIKLVDHVIVGINNYYSFLENGDL